MNSLRIPVCVLCKGSESVHLEEVLNWNTKIAVTLHDMSEWINRVCILL